MIEEIKPGFFIEQRGKKWKQVYPLSYNGKSLLKQRIKEIFTIRTMLTIAIVLFVAWRYKEETSYCTQLQIDPCALYPNMTTICTQEVFNAKPNDTYTISNITFKDIRT